MKICIHQSRTSSNEIVPVCIYISERERPITLSILVFPPFKVHVRRNLARMEEHVTPLETRCTFVSVNLSSLEEVARKVGYRRIGLCAHFYVVYFV